MTSVPSMITVPTKTTLLTLPIMVMTKSTMTMLTSVIGAQNDHRTDNNTYQNAHSMHGTPAFILGLKSYSPLLQTHYHILPYPQNKT